MLAILLAAGRGRRLGGPKTLVELGGRPALLRCIDALTGGGARTVRVVLAPGADAERRLLDAHAATWLARHGATVEVALNPRPELGQTSSLLAALSAGWPGGEAFLLHVVDHPLVAAADVAAVCAAWEQREPHHALALPAVGGRRGHPALFAAALVEEFIELAPDRPAHAVVRRDAARVLEVPLGNPWLVRDIDTPEDLAAARAALGEHGPRPADR